MKGNVLILLAALGVYGAGNNEAHAQVNYAWVTVGNPGNPSNPFDPRGPGSVGYTYSIMATEVNLFQYTEFLNAADPNGLNVLGLYNGSMATNLNIAGISFASGAAAGSKYAVIGSGLRPVTYVSWFDAVRFVNWLHNGQGGGSTETGVYDMSQVTPISLPARSASATYWIPSENEWYKAAFYDLNASSTWRSYPTGLTLPGNKIGPSANQANYFGDGDFGGSDYSVTQSGLYEPTQNYLTDGGAFSGSRSYYGTYDQAGNVTEWIEDDYYQAHPLVRDGNWHDNDFRLSFTWAFPPFDGAIEETPYLGFRIAGIAGVPEPSALGLMVLAGGALLWWKRRKITL